MPRAEIAAIPVRADAEPLTLGRLDFVDRGTDPLGVELEAFAATLDPRQYARVVATHGGREVGSRPVPGDTPDAGEL